MALIINHSLKLKTGIELQSFYIRLDVKLSLDGKTVQSELYFYVDKNTYLDGYSPIRIHEGFNFHYDRNIDGSDILIFAHNKTKEQLELTSREPESVQEIFGYSNITISL